VSGFKTLLGKELREQVRTYRLPLTLIIFVLFGISSPALARFTKELLDLLGEQAAGGMQIVLPDPTVADAVGQLIKNMGQFGILLAILLAMSTVATEKERGTAAFVLTKPASRPAFLLAKFIAIAITLAVAVAAGCALGWIYSVLLFEGSDLSILGFVGLAVLLWLTIMAFASLTFLGSTITKSAGGAAGFGFVALIVTAILSALPTIGQFMPTALNDPAAKLALGLPPGDWLAPLIGCLCFVLIPFGIAVVSFRRQEL
jgi:ABC-2 type transport system permease protein